MQAGGGHTRSIEKQSVRFCNTPSVMQNYYVENGMLFYALSNDKGREKKNGVEKHIACFTDSDSTRLMLVFLLLVKRIMQVITAALQLALVIVALVDWLLLCAYLQKMAHSLTQKTFKKLFLFVLTTLVLAWQHFSIDAARLE